jgi:hypothetical protein
VISIAEHTTTETEAREVEKSQRRDLTASRYGSGMIAAMETAAPTITSTATELSPCRASSRFFASRRNSAELSLKYSGLLFFGI